MFMIISHKYKFIFIKTRKTAGSSIEWFLDKYLDKNDISTGSIIDNLPSRNINIDGHIGWKTIKQMFPNEWSNYFKFAVDRNPWDRTVSQYFWYQKIKPHKTKKGFNDFVKSSKFKNLNDWKLYASDIVQVNEVVRYEDLHNWFKSQTSIPYNNELLTTFIKGDVRKDREYKKFFNNETNSIIEKVYNNQIQLLGYSKND